MKNDTGPDHAVHELAGCPAAGGPHVPARGGIADASIHDVVSALRGLFDPPAASAMAGRRLW